MTDINECIAKTQTEFDQFMIDAERHPQEIDLDLTGFPWKGSATFHDRPGIQFYDQAGQPKLPSLLYVEDAVPILRALNRLALLRTQLRAASDALLAGAGQFRFYEEEHYKKGANEKAFTNKIWADQLMNAGVAAAKALADE